MTDNIKITIVREGQLGEVDDAKFAAKMTHEQRCAALALHTIGASWKHLAAFFKVHYRTIQMIKTGPRYKEVRKAFNAMGQDSFVDHYLSDALREEFKAFQSQRAEEPVHQSEDPAKPGWAPRKYANGKEGRHEKKSLYDGEPVVFHVEWRFTAGDLQQGWYAIYNEHREGPFANSQLAYDAAEMWWNPATTAPAIDAEKDEADRLFSTAKHARAAMEIEPCGRTITAFEQAAFAVYRFVDKSEGLPEPTEAEMQARIDWRGFDPESHRNK